MGIRRPVPQDGGGFWIVLLAVIPLIIVFAVSIAASNKKSVDPEVVSKSSLGATAKYDDHLWIFWVCRDAVTHHPDCPCRKAEKE